MNREPITAEARRDHHHHHSGRAWTFKGRDKWLLGVLLALIVATLAGMLLTRPRPQTPGKANHSIFRELRERLDEQSLTTARSLISLSYTREEHSLTRRALKLADEEVDLAFAIALRDAADSSRVPANETIRKLREQLKEAQAVVDTDKETIDKLRELEKAPRSARAKQAGDLQQQIATAEAQFELDKEQVADIKLSLLVNGGDPQAILRRLLDQHEALHKQEIKLPDSDPLVESWTMLSHLEALRALRGKQQKLQAAAAAADTTAKSLQQIHDELSQKVQRHRANIDPSATGDPVRADKMRKAGTELKNLTDYGRRVEYLRELGDTYREWQNLLVSRQRASLFGILLSTLWILLVLLGAFVATHFVVRFGRALPPERKRLHSLQLVARLAVRAVALLAVLFVIFGAPGQTTTVLGLAGAGLTVALKDFIVAFFGWFVLMGKNGIRVGDWVEINGIGGEVVEIGILRTVLLETGQWRDAGHPTGRKVAFVNSFAIEGHYFNFSTTGQWLWDELDILIPPGIDPYHTLYGVREIVTKATEPSARDAEREWQKVAGSHALQSFSAAPAIALKPTSMGLDIAVRYITRAHQRYELRGQLNSAIVELIHRRGAEPQEKPAEAAK